MPVAIVVGRLGVELVLELFALVDENEAELVLLTGQNEEALQVQKVLEALLVRVLVEGNVVLEEHAPVVAPLRVVRIDDDWALLLLLLLLMCVVTQRRGFDRILALVEPAVNGRLLNGRFVGSFVERRLARDRCSRGVRDRRSGSCLCRRCYVAQRAVMVATTAAAATKALCRRAWRLRVRLDYRKFAMRLR